MSLGQVHHVDVVPDSGAVRGVVVVAEYGQVGSTTHGHLRHVGHEIVRGSVGVLADHSARVGADGVEVPEHRDAPVVGLLGDRLGLTRLEVAQDLLDHELRPAVGVSDSGPDRALLGDGHLGAAVDGGRGGEDDAVAAVLVQQAEQVDRRAEVVRVVHERLLDALPDGVETGEVDAGVEAAAGLEHLLEGGLVTEVGLHESQSVAAAGHLPDAADGLLGGVDERIDHGAAEAAAEEGEAGVAPYVARPAGDEDVLLVLLGHGWGREDGTGFGRDESGQSEEGDRSQHSRLAENTGQSEVLATATIATMLLYYWSYFPLLAPAALGRSRRRGPRHFVIQIESFILNFLIEQFFQ